MKKLFYFLGHTLVNSLLLAILVIVFALPIGFSLSFLTSKEIVSPSFRLIPSSSNYQGYLNFANVAGGQAEEITVQYTSFPDFEAFYDGIYVVENTWKIDQIFVLSWPEEKNLRFFFGKPGETEGPRKITLRPGEKAAINLAVGRTSQKNPQTDTVVFTLQSFPRK